jgi:hypothetical protein
VKDHPSFTEDSTREGCVRYAMSLPIARWRAQITRAYWTDHVVYVLMPVLRPLDGHARAIPRCRDSVLTGSCGVWSFPSLCIVLAHQRLIVRPHSLSKKAQLRAPAIKAHS